MKKYIIVVFALCVASFTFAQENTKVKLEKKGDLVEATYFYDSGAVEQKGTFKNNKLHGVWTSYTEAGKKLAVGAYDQGRKVGKWFFWTDAKLSEVDYIDSRIVSVNEWKDKINVAVRNR